MSNAISTIQPAFPTGADFDAMRNAAAIISRSGLVPEHFRGKPEDVMVALLTGRGLGLDPMVALQKGYVVKGKFDVEVSVKLGLVMSRIPQFSYDVIEHTHEKCILEGGIGDRKQRVEFTLEQAKRMGITNKDTWRGSPEDMLMWRALGRLIKRTCPHAMYNMPVYIDDDEQASVTESASGNQAAGPAATTLVATPLPAEAKSAEVPDDNRGDLLREIAKAYGIQPPGAHKNSYAKWIKENAATIASVCKAFYASCGEQAPAGWAKIPDSDYRRITAWVAENGEVKAEADDNNELFSKDPHRGTPAKELSLAEVLDNNGWSPAVKATSGHMALADKPFDFFVSLLSSMALATKGSRMFFMKSEGSGKHMLLDSELLVACGYVGERGLAESRWLEDIYANKAEWQVLCQHVVSECEDLKISYL